MADSSPAPFWKFVGQTPGDIGIGTGGLPSMYGSSPVKLGDSGAGGDAAGRRRGDSSSSSPGLPASPSAHRNGVNTSGTFANRVENAAAVRSNLKETFGASHDIAPKLEETRQDEEEEEEEEEGLDGGIDLMK